MQKLNKNYVNENGLQEKQLLNINKKIPATERVLQFGGGNFLRAFVDYFIDVMNEKSLFDGSVVVIKPIPNRNENTISVEDHINKQDGLYTTFLNDSTGSDGRIITSISRCIDPHIDYNAYEKVFLQEDIRFIVSNTTEAGIVYDENVKLTDTLPKNFPGKITSLLYKRYKHFDGAKDKGFIFIPCELIDDNGKTLKEIILKHSKDWGLEEGFVTWVKESNYFTNTLVDRIVTGFPKNKEEYYERTGFIDDMLVTAEKFGFFAVEIEEGDDFIADEFPLEKAGLAIYTKDVSPYKLRKVRILNGAHTSTALLGHLLGLETVLELSNDDIMGKFLKKAIFEEIIPSITELGEEELISFADDVVKRFKNPYIEHQLMSIALNSVSKFAVRVVPSILGYVQNKKELPKMLTISFAALIKFYEKYPEENTGESKGLREELSKIQGFEELLSNYLEAMETDIHAFLKEVL